MADATLIAHCGGKVVTREDVRAVETPKPHARYMPVDYDQLLTMVEDMAENVLGLPLKSAEYALNKTGKQMFAAYTYQHEHDESGLAIGVRSSHDKKLPVGVAAGARVFVCDNLAFSGNNMRVVRRHTRNVWSDIREQVAEGLSNAARVHEIMVHDWEKMKKVTLSEDDGFSLLGRAIGHDVLKPLQATRAFKGWGGEFVKAEEALFPQHGPTLYGLYQAMTEGAKQGAAGERFEVLAGIDGFVRQAHDQLLVVDSPAQLPAPEPKADPLGGLSPLQVVRRIEAGLEID